MNTQSLCVSTTPPLRQAAWGRCRCGLRPAGEYFRGTRACQPGDENLSDSWSRFVQRCEGLWPASCLLCDTAAGAGGADLCAACEDDLPHIAQACRLCAVELAAPTTMPCGACQRRRPPFQSSFCAFRYDYPVNHLVRNLKYHGALHWGRALGSLLAARIPVLEPRPTLLVPVPLATARFRERGYNQATEIAAAVGRRLQLPLRTDLLLRVRDTQEQAGLDSKARRKNVRGAFAVTRPLAGARIALIDDVITTGNTVREIARVLRRAGAAHIRVWAVARVTK